MTSEQEQNIFQVEKPSKNNSVGSSLTLINPRIAFQPQINSVKHEEAPIEAIPRKQKIKLPKSNLLKAKV